MARVSLIIPTHDRPTRLPQAVASARAAGRDVEVIVIDDASTDETAQVCQTLSGIHYYRVERNQGVAGARNLGIFESAAPYIAFLDDDDLRLPGSLDSQADLLDHDPMTSTVPPAARIFSAAALEKRCAETERGLVRLPSPRTFTAMVATRTRPASASAAGVTAVPGAKRSRSFTFRMAYSVRKTLTKPRLGTRR